MNSEHPAVAIVQAFLDASMAPDPVRAASYMAQDVRITFTGKRVMADTRAITAFNAGRYRWVKKQLGQFDWMDRGDHVVVYSNGTLYGEWPDGRSFSGNRYLDRFEVRAGKITRMDVWNDSAEWILVSEVGQSAE
ncbi:nuclear transport factor 2 family protein [Affinibrenneria salicis]|uniref:Nuclear transport factor 2 family protein n=1 Tax=Affinibrenneria salicis TaxID=2590031 RepID=A0A5J5FUG7_9GAMM|nr:nuclear transport factor 2 family protein [Affinibrenneria salicis]KAA8996917.1 nuclear transport factor 2 family protein [Affinibrenneria salicis]